MAFADLSDGLIAYYPFNGNANDESENLNHGTVYQAVLHNDRFGTPQSAYKFDGSNDYISVASNTLFDVNEITLSAWINVAAFPLTGDSGKIVMRDDTASSRIFQFRVLQDGTIGFIALDKPVTSWDINVVTTKQIELDQWYHVVATFDETKGGNIWVNAENWGYDNEFSGSLSSGTAPIVLGGSSINPKALNGILDDVRIYNRCLSDIEIKELYSYPQCINLTEKPFTFSPGTPARASEVNENFDILYNQVNKLTCEIGILKTIVCQDHPDLELCK
jgi:hypothetical protein